MNLKGVDESTRQIPIVEKLTRLDLPGVVVLIGSVSCLFLALQEGGAKVPWSSSRPIGLFIGFGLLLIVFGMWQWRLGTNATIPVAFLRNRTVFWGSFYLLWDNMACYIVRCISSSTKILG